MKTIYERKRESHFIFEGLVLLMPVEAPYEKSCPRTSTPQGGRNIRQEIHKVHRPCDIGVLFLHPSSILVSCVAQTYVILHGEVAYSNWAATIPQQDRAID